MTKKKTKKVSSKDSKTKVVTKEKEVKTPNHVKLAAKTLAEQFNCKVEESKLDDQWVLLVSDLKDKSKLPTRWKGLMTKLQ